MAARTKRIPVILDTDTGSDIDDSWALAMLLNCPELDPKLVVSATGDTTYRAKLIGRILEAAGRTDIPIGIGCPFPQKNRRLEDLTNSYDLAKYPGQVYEDGVGTIVDTVMSSPEPITLICIGPLPNIGLALERQPLIAQKARFVGMHGCIRRGIPPEPVKPECNVRNHTPHCQKAFTAPWDMTITPLDTCGTVVLKGSMYAAVEQCAHPMIRELMAQYRLWSVRRNGREPAGISSILFDTVAVYLAFSDEYLSMENLPIAVTDEGNTVIDPSAKHINCAMDWKDQDAFEDLLVARLIQ